MRSVGRSLLIARPRLLPASAETRVGAHDGRRGELRSGECYFLQVEKDKKHRAPWTYFVSVSQSPSCALVLGELRSNGRYSSRAEKDRRHRGDLRYFVSDRSLMRPDAQRLVVVLEPRLHLAFRGFAVSL